MVQPARPVKAVGIISGNDLARSSVWACGQPSLIVTSSPSVSRQLDGNALRFPEVFTARTVTCAESKTEPMSEQSKVLPSV